MLRMVTFIQVTNAVQAGKEWLKAFALQVIQQSDGRNIRVQVTAGLMFSFTEYAGSVMGLFVAG